MLAKTPLSLFKIETASLPQMTFSIFPLPTPSLSRSPFPFSFSSYGGIPEMQLQCGPAGGAGIPARPEWKSYKHRCECSAEVRAEGA